MNSYTISDLVFDSAIYPRISPDDLHVQALADVIESDAELPPIVICSTTRKIIDGVHRVRAYEKIYGEYYQVACIGKKYRNQSEMLLDAIRLNAKHGNPLNLADRQYCQTLSASIGVDINDLAQAFGVNVSLLGNLSVARFDRKLSGTYARQNAAHSEQNQEFSRCGRYGDKSASPKRTVQDVCAKAMRWFDAVNRGDKGDELDIAVAELMDACRRHRESVINRASV